MSKRGRAAQRASGAAPISSPLSRDRIETVPLVRFAPWLIALVGIATYGNALHGPFVWDDAHAILANPSIRTIPSSLNPSPDMPFTTRPLVNLSFALNYAAGQVDVFGYHAVNLGLHILAALTLFGIVRRTLTRDRCAPMFASVATPLALLVALWWMVHPLASEVVDYVTQRTETLMGLCLFATVYAAIRALDARRARTWTLLSIAVCAAGMAAKETMVIAPIIVALYDRAFVFASWRDAVRARRGLYGGLAATWIVLIIILTVHFVPYAKYTTGIGLGTYLLNQVLIIPRYLELVVVPYRLVFDYGMPATLTLVDVWWQAVLLLAAMSATLFCLVRRPTVGVLLVMFWLGLAPTSLIIVPTEAGAGRRMYLSLAVCAATLFPASWALLRNRLSGSTGISRRRFERIAAAVAILWVGVLAARTVARNHEFSDPVSLWDTSVARWPSGRARYSYAMALLKQGHRMEARRQFALAVDDFPQARLALAIELTESGQDLTAAAGHLQALIRDAKTSQDVIDARGEYGRLLSKRGKTEAAAEQFRAVLAMAPRDPVANAGMGELLLHQRRYREAVPYYQVHLQSGPTDMAGALRELGLAQLGAGDYKGAAESLQRSLAVDSRSAVSHVSLANALFRLRRMDEGEAHARRGVELDPTNADGQTLLGVALASRGQIAEAILHFREAVRLNPAQQLARDNLALAERQLRMPGR